MYFNKIAALFVFCALFAVSAWSETAGRDFDPVLKLKDNQKEFVEAVRTYDRAQNALAKADRMIADTYAKQKNDVVAKAKLEKAKERIANVKELYKIAMGYYTGDALLHNYYGELLYDRYNDIPGALMEWNKAISFDVKLSQAYNNLGLHDVHYGNYAPGLRNLEKALELEPENPDYLYNLAQIYLVNTPQVCEIKKIEKDKLYKEAMKMSKGAAQFAPDEFELVQDYAVNFFAAENFGLDTDWKEAARAWGAARAIAHSTDEKFYTWLNEARVWIKIGDTVQAKRCLGEALMLRPESEVAKKLMAEQNKVPDAAVPAPATQEPALEPVTPAPTVEEPAPVVIAPASPIEDATPDAGK